MQIFRKILISIAIAFVTVGTVAASSEAVAHNVPEPDSMSGVYWERVIDSRRPAAPPRLIPRHRIVTPSGDTEESHGRVVCVRAGEHLLLHGICTGSSAVSLAAIALENGVCGGRVRARIEVTGALTEIIVLGHGTGALQSKEDKWR